jgi:hypothetical protein
MSHVMKVVVAGAIAMASACSSNEKTLVEDGGGDGGVGDTPTDPDPFPPPGIQRLPDLDINS